MRDAAAQLLYLMNTRERLHLVAIFGLVLFNALFEMVSVSLVVPFIYMVTEPAAFQEQPAIQWLYAVLNVQTVNGFFLWCSVGIIAIFVLKNAYIGFVIYMQGRFVKQKYTALALQLFNAYLYGPYTFHLQRNSAGLLRNIVEDAHSVCQKILLPGLRLITDLTVIVVVSLLLVFFDPLSFLLVSVLLGGATVSFYKIIRQRMGELGEIGHTSAQQRIQWVQQGMGGIKEIKVRGCEPYFSGALQHWMQIVAHVLYVQEIIQTLPRLFNEVIMVVGAMLVIVVALLQGYTLQAILPTLSLFIAAGYRLIPCASRVASYLTILRVSLPALKVISTDLKLLADVAPRASASSPALAPVAGAPAIELANVSYHYPGSSANALQQLTLTVQTNQSIGIVGPSGSGKTTIVDVMLGLLGPQQGDVRISGHSIYQHMASLRQSIGYIPQSIYLVDDTIRSNVAFGLPPDEIDEAAVWRAVGLAQLERFITSLPDGLDTLIGERGVRLSGGQQQRIGIARALYHDPGILIMDEATAALDNETEQAFVQAIERLGGQKTMVIIAHRLSTVRTCDRLYFIRDGAVADTGTYDQLLAQNAEFRAMATVDAPSLWSRWLVRLRGDQGRTATNR